jgi:biopolymer transport protein ExbB
MRKSFLIRTFLLAVALAMVAAIMFYAVSFGRKAVTEIAPRQSLFEQFVTAGGPIVWFVLLPMSVGMVYLAAELALTIRRKKLLPADARTNIVEIIRRQGAGGLAAELAESTDFLSTAVASAVSQAGGDWFRLRNLLFESLQQQTGRLVRKTDWLNLIGNVSPMVGLFGTVVGMIKLFNTIVTAGGQPHPAQLADGISVALVTTFWGLLIAIPALAIHGVFQNRLETLLSDAIAEAELILPTLKLPLTSSSTAEQQKHSQPLPPRGTSAPPSALPKQVMEVRSKSQAPPVVSKPVLSEVERAEPLRQSSSPL